MKEQYKIIISGGGTGGHIFPAISIANALKEKDPKLEILFVGAEGRMEMERVPAAGYKIIGLPVMGFIRRLTLMNFTVLWNLMRSLRKAKRIVKDFQPDAVVGVGGYASGPLLKAAVRQGVPALVQEQNSYAGVTNKLLGKQASKVCVAYEGMDKFFPKEKIIITGNPVRQNLMNAISQKEGKAHFGLSEDKKMILVVGGSLGARTINNSIQEHLANIEAAGVSMIWQTGKYYFEEMKKMAPDSNDILVTDFVSRMDMAYAAADLVISRAGAGTISELALLGKSVILVPSPNVSEDHQTQNAMALVKNDAAVMIRDVDAPALLVETALKTLVDDTKLKDLKKNILKMALPDSANLIAEEVFKLINNKKLKKN